MCFKTITPRLLTRICLTLFLFLFPNNMLRKWLVPSNYISCPAEENSEVKNSFDSRIICTQRWSPRQLTNNYNGEKNTGKRNRTTLMVVVRGTIHTFVSSHFLSSCEKLRKKIEHYIDVMQIDTNDFWTLMVDRKIKQRGIKLFTQNTLNVLKLYE